MTPDPIADLEAELVDVWRRGTIRTRERAHRIHPKLDPACYPLLMLLTRQDEAVPMAVLLTQLVVEKSTLTRQIDALTRLGLARRTPDPEDARARLVSLTEEGRSLLSEQRAEAVAAWRRELSQWDADDLRTLTSLLHRLGSSVDRG
ncbi:MarR family transcriptional regulator [Rhodococcus spelaei]|uniref:MarR family transcriptional regulator n=1 Tax=Rhodococcus spelaei TaxID=2546320 RepID=A0A541BLS4_9NOCA|nr:MarR family transcriptional regulator [Rhodococcus spelaei]TQF73292.1 MarR family transcriptional regulator [Rhodococcus spelaei]